MKQRKPRAPVFGVIAEFATADELVRAITRARGHGYTRLEAYTPLPVHAVTEALGAKNRLPLIVLAGGLVGLVGGYAMQYYTAAVDYPINVAGRPLNSWPAFVIVTFETTILCAALAAVLGMLALNGLPRPHHPVFGVPIFELASRNRFFLLLIHDDPLFEVETARRFLSDLESLSVAEVPH